MSMKQTPASFHAACSFPPAEQQRVAVTGARRTHTLKLGGCRHQARSRGSLLAQSELLSTRQCPSITSGQMDAGALAALEARLQAPLVPLKHVKPPSTQPGHIPRRPATLPASAPFGPQWHSKHGQWSVETLVFPAAYPRSIARSTTSTPPRKDKRSATSTPPARLSKEQIDQAVQDIVDNQRTARLVKPDLSQSNGSNSLWIAVNRYTPMGKQKKNETTSSKDPVTLVYAHANGFSKEVSLQFVRAVRWISSAMR